MRTILLGLDAFDPKIFEHLVEQGRMQNLGKYLASRSYSSFSVSNPPQSEVSWTSIATGADPGVHGMFDFVHREPASYSITPSLLATKTNVLGTQFVPPYTARTLFEQATIEGFPANVLWWPATFPARMEIPVATIPGLGTPDVQGRLGVGALYSPDQSLADPKFKTPIELLNRRSQGVYNATLNGPVQKNRQGQREIQLDFQLTFQDDQHARLTFDRESIDLVEGQWSPIFEVKFKAGFLASIRAITRVILTQVEPEPRLYFLPLQIHPLHSTWRYGTPPGFLREAWEGFGPFLTLGWPQDTTGLDEGWITDDQFISLCKAIDETREKIFFHFLGKFREGVLANVFDTLDRVQHMFLHDQPEVVESWYLHLDDLVGKVEQRLNQSNQVKPRLIIVSDHGFAQFDHKVHLNQWLVENNYLTPKSASQERSLNDVDWSESKAYALGLNSLYLNIQGREGRGCVAPDEIEPLRERLRDDLLSWKGPDGRSVIQQVYRREEVFSEARRALAPDLVVGYTPGYRASAETGLGKWEPHTLEGNHDHWHADHCIDPQAVPGVIFTNFGLGEVTKPSFRDIPALAIGKQLSHPDEPLDLPTRKSGGEQTDEERKAMEERLKGLGYL